jgi:hypothetical protein
MEAIEAMEDFPPGPAGPILPSGMRDMHDAVRQLGHMMSEARPSMLDLRCSMSDVVSRTQQNRTKPTKHPRSHTASTDPSGPQPTEGASLNTIKPTNDKLAALSLTHCAPTYFTLFQPFPAFPSVFFSVAAALSALRTARCARIANAQ